MGKSKINSLSENTNTEITKTVLTSQEKSENDKLIELVEKLGMNSTTKKKIFVVMMTSRDVEGK